MPTWLMPWPVCSVHIARNFDRLAIPQLVAMTAALPAYSVVDQSLDPIAAWLDTL